MRNRPLLYIFLVATTLLAACATHKNNLAVLAKENIVAQGSLTVKTDSRELSAPARLAMSRGKLIRLQVMMPLLGSEMVRAEFSPTEVLVIDKMGKRHIRKTYQAINLLAGTSLSYAYVEQMVVGYLKDQQPLTLQLPGNERPQTVVLKADFDSIKAADETLQPTAVAAKYKEMEIEELFTKLLQIR